MFLNTCALDSMNLKYKCDLALIIANSDSVKSNSLGSGLVSLLFDDWPERCELVVGLLCVLIL